MSKSGRTEGHNQYIDFSGCYSGCVQYDADQNRYCWHLYFVSFVYGRLSSGWANSKKEAVLSLCGKAEQLGASRRQNKNA